MVEFFIYYVRGRVFEWTMALAMLFTGLELLIWDSVLSTSNPFIISQKWIGTVMLFTGWLRLSSLMFNGQLLFGRRFGWGIRAICAVISASILAQFAFYLLVVSIEHGVPSLGLPFWTLITFAELLVAYSIGVEWKK